MQPQSIVPKKPGKAQLLLFSALASCGITSTSPAFSSHRWHSGTREREKEAPLQSGRQMQICRPSLSMRLKSSQAPSARKCSLEPCPGALASTTTPFQKDCGASGMVSALCALAPRPLVTTTYHITEHFLGTAVHLVPNILVLVELFINLVPVSSLGPF